MIELRPAANGDIDHLKRALFEAVSWNPERELPPLHGRRSRAQLRRRRDARARGRRLEWSPGEGIGTLLMGAIEEAARLAGFSRISLSVDAKNPARRLYERLGYETLTVDDEGVRMLKRL